MAKSDPTKASEFKRVLGNLLKLPPKPHSDMKLGAREQVPRTKKTSAKKKKRL